MKQVLAIFLCLLTFTALTCGQDSPLLLQRPTLSKTHIAFNFAGDLWIVERGGGEAKQLTTGVGVEIEPIFSPDGSQIAFTGQYDGNTDVFVVAATGGVPKRLTFHPGADQAVGWTNDGKRVLFSSGRNSYQGFPRLFTIGTDGRARIVFARWRVSGLRTIDSMAARMEALQRRPAGRDLDCEA